MATLSRQKKTQQRRLPFRQFLPLLCACALGCQQSDPQVKDADSEPAQLAGIIASIDSGSLKNSLEDGQKVGGRQLGNAALGDVGSGNRANWDAGERAVGPLKSIDTQLGASETRFRHSLLPETGLDPNSELPEEVASALQEIHVLRGSAIDATGAAALQIRRRRNFRIIELATRSLPATMTSLADESTFLRLIRFLLEARLELAVSGNAEDVQSLYADVRALTNRSPDSDAASEGIYTLARFAHEMVRRKGHVEPVWYDNFTQWAREFARRFPIQADRATALLLGSARSCELRAYDLNDSEEVAKLNALAKQNYEQLIADFSDSDAAMEATAVLRRLNLPGQKLEQFSGESLTGQQLDSHTFHDVVSVIYFWDHRDPKFSGKLLPLLQQADEVADGQLRFVGIPLCDDRIAVQEFLQRHHVPGDQIVGADAAHSGWNHSVVRFYGVARGATCWLVNQNQTVSAVDVPAENLVDEMRRLFPASGSETTD